MIHYSIFIEGFKDKGVDVLPLVLWMVCSNNTLNLLFGIKSVDRHKCLVLPLHHSEPREGRKRRESQGNDPTGVLVSCLLPFPPA